jgi:hypothetical protein
MGQLLCALAGHEVGATFADALQRETGGNPLFVRELLLHLIEEGKIERAGEPRHCQGTVLADWVAVNADGQERMSGTNVFVLGPDGRIESATGLLRTDQRKPA